MKLLKIGRVVFLAFLSAALVGCADNKSPSSTEFLNIIGGSELKSIEPLLANIKKETGVTVDIKYTGTIEGVEDVRVGNYDAAWFSSSKYFYEDAEVSKKIKMSEKIMFSPVIIGLKPESAKAHNIKEDGVYSWSDISKWVAQKGMTYAMTDPSVSNSGYVALMGLVYSAANKGVNVKESDVNESQLKKFFEGQKLTAKSSNWIMDKFNEDKGLDFVVNYESAILKNKTKLIPIYPNEGIVTSDYPMMLINPGKMESYKKVVAFLKSEIIQRKLVNDYGYRAINVDVMVKQNVFDLSKLLVEMPFNPDTQLSNKILSAYFDKYKKPAEFALVMDVSGSMRGERERMMKDAIQKLVSGELSRYATIRDRETVLVVPFSSQVHSITKFNKASKNELNNFVQSFKMDGGTAMYSAVSEAMIELYKSKKDKGDKFRYSVIVLTDGLSNEGASFKQFEYWYKENGLDKEDIKVFAISFGDADMNQLNAITGLTGGRVFDGKKLLSAAFREIRAYQ